MDLENNSAIGEVATPETEVNTEVSTENSNVESEQGEVAAPTTEEKQSQEENAKYAVARREAEAKAKQFENELLASKKVQEAVKRFGIKGDTPDEIAENLLLLYQENEAAKAGMELKEFQEFEKQQQEAEEKQLKELLENSPEIIRARELEAEAQKIIFERQFETDLATIKAKFPECQAKTIEEIGETYMSLMATAESSGKPLNPIVAYIAQMENDKLNTKPIPPSMGSASSTDNAVEKEFYTSDEVDRLTERQLSDPKIWERVRRSMTKWK